MTIPANIDHLALVCDLGRWGWSDTKIELVCGFSRGYVAHIRAGDVKQMIYQRAARLYNLWWEERCRKLSGVEPIFPGKAVRG
jgi:hypothetical protein